jgi:hypothetical protein
MFCKRHHPDITFHIIPYCVQSVETVEFFPHSSITSSLSYYGWRAFEVHTPVHRCRPTVLESAAEAIEGFNPPSFARLPNPGSVQLVQS